MRESTMPAPGTPRGMRTFILVWLGSTVSSMGSALTGFVLGVWAFQETGSATLFSLIAVASMVPGLLAAPFGGVLADRWDRRRTMIGGTSVAATVTAATALLMVTGRLEVWHLYTTAAVLSLVLAVHRPASMGATTVLIPPHQFARANGMLQFGGATIRIVAPILAGILLASMTPAGVLFLDLATFGVVLAVLFSVRIPRPPAHAHGMARRASLFSDAATGWRYVRERPGIFGLLVYFATIGVAPAVAMVLMTPLVLRIANEVVLGTVMAAGGAGALAGGFLMSAWGGPRRRFHGIVAAGVLLGVSVIVAGLTPHPLLIAAGAFGIGLGGPVMTSCFNAIWQVKTPLELHGRVFATITMVAESSAPFALLAAAPLADFLFEPLLLPGGALVDTVGMVVGVGAGRGLGLLYLLVGSFVLVVTAVASRLPRLRNAEDELEDAVRTAPFAMPAPAAEPHPVPAPSA